ncbi:MAG: hypothetical protein IKE75_03015 [Bacilli bacterium]|nr:hypothetical protein [Bacilli bacterium]
MELLWQALRQVVFILDQVAYGLIPSAYELIFYMANINLFNNDILSALINRVYLLLGIFMLFKVAFSLLQYMIDPNTFNDKAKGFGKLITNTLVAMILLVMTPFIFEKAYDIQGDILLSNIIPRLILGDTSYNDYTGDDGEINTDAVTEKQAEIHSMGVDVQFTLFSAFYTLNTDNNADGYTACRPTSEAPLKNVIGSSDMLNDSECWGAVQGDLTNELHRNGGTVRGMFKYSRSAAADAGESEEELATKCSDDICDERNFSNFGALLWWIKAGGNSPFTITYIPIISAIVGGYLLLLLITFVIDIAARVFKLLFLQAIAPIAIISYMDPNESVGSGKFHNWLVECGKTYGSLFLRLAVIYAAIQLVRVILSSVFGATADGSSIYYNGISPTGALNIFVYIFLILGVFTFAKKLPQMIESIFGIKLSGEMSLNPFKSIRENIGATALIGGAVGLGAGGLAAAREGFQESGGGLRGIGHGLRSGILGGISGAVGGARNGFMNNGQTGYVGRAARQGGRVAWNMNNRHTTSLRSRLETGMAGVTGAPLPSYVDEQNSAVYKRFEENADAIRKNMEEQRDRDATVRAAQAALTFAENNGTDTDIIAAQARLRAARDNWENNVFRGHEANFLNDDSMARWAENERINREHRSLAGFNGANHLSFEDMTNASLTNSRRQAVQQARAELEHSNAFEDNQRAGRNFERHSHREWQAHR